MTYHLTAHAKYELTEQFEFFRADITAFKGFLWEAQLLNDTFNDIVVSGRISERLISALKALRDANLELNAAAESCSMTSVQRQVYNMRSELIGEIAAVAEAIEDGTLEATRA